MSFSECQFIKPLPGRPLMGDTSTSFTSRLRRSHFLSKSPGWDRPLLHDPLGPVLTLHITDLFMAGLPTER